MSETWQEKLQNDPRVQIWQELGSLATDHIQSSGGKLTLLDKEYPGGEEQVPEYLAYLDRRLDHHLEGTPIVPSAIESVASLADKRFPAIQERIDELTARESHSLAVVAQRLEAGDNIILATNHGELTDIALVFAAMCSSLGKSGSEELFRRKMRRGIIVSQIISRVGLNLGLGATPEHDGGQPKPQPTAATDALKMLCNDVWKSYPRTPSVTELRERMPRMIQYHNGLMLMSIHRALNKGGLLLAMAPSGSKDRPLPNDPATRVLNPLNKRTIEMMKHDKTYTLFMAAWLQGEAPRIEFSHSEINGRSVAGVPKRIKTDFEAHREMEALAATLEDMIPDQNFLYKKAPEATRHSVRQGR